MSLKTFSFLLWGLLVMPACIFSQTNSGKEYAGNGTDCMFFHPDTAENNSTASLPYAAIVVSDVRADTNKMGYLYPATDGNSSRVCMREPAGKMISSFMNKYFSSHFTGNGDTVFAFLKKLWISNEETGSADFFINIKLEFYLKKKSCFYPLYRFDNTLTMNGDNEKTPGVLMKNALVASMQKLYRTDAFNLQNLRCISATQIDSFNYPLRYVPVLRDGITRKGLYLNFKQFRNNKPAYPDFKIGQDETFDVLYVKGKVLPDSAITDAWGFSNGERIFIRRANNFFPLHRAGDNFEFFAYNQASRKSALSIDPRNPFSVYPYSSSGSPVIVALDIGVSHILRNIRSRSKDLQLFQLDMETGRVY